MVGYGQEEHVHIRFNSVIGVFIVINSRRRINSMSLSFSLNCFGGSFMDKTGGYYSIEEGQGRHGSGSKVINPLRLHCVMVYDFTTITCSAVAVRRRRRD